MKRQIWNRGSPHGMGDCLVAARCLGSPTLLVAVTEWQRRGSRASRAILEFKPVVTGRGTVQRTRSVGVETAE
ncbi:hypothetical protein NDU88_006848 [Pleurodeles waltl]|uniref:DUF397 domain-containing protein n=1 Tax=Pleurodeles waltl TaxID=8319 RepID=A0AAV7UNT4_PLEWA|nr:hypothetical protein NDU88_006848 [Pleurodeles waltl]